MEEHLFNSKEALDLWDKADDGIKRRRLLHEIYNDVPKELRHIYVSIYELHVIDSNKRVRSKVLKWLDEEKMKYKKVYKNV
jgi:hypothetical protein